MSNTIFILQKKKKSKINKKSQHAECQIFW